MSIFFFILQILSFLSLKIFKALQVSPESIRFSKYKQYSISFRPWSFLTGTALEINLTVVCKCLSWRSESRKWNWKKKRKNFFYWFWKIFTIIIVETSSNKSSKTKNLPKIHKRRTFISNLIFFKKIDI